MHINRTYFEVLFDIIMSQKKSYVGVNAAKLLIFIATGKAALHFKRTTEKTTLHFKRTTGKATLKAAEIILKF